MSEIREHSRVSRGLSIGEAAKASGLTAKTIRYYEQIGLIPKARRRGSAAAPHTGGDRIYSEDDIGRLRFIRHARLVDLSLADIRELLDIADKAGCPSEHPAYSDVLKRHRRQIDERINHLLGLRTVVQNLLSPARQMNSETCTWSTCSCMQADAARSPLTIVVAPTGNRPSKSDV